MSEREAREREREERRVECEERKVMRQRGAREGKVASLIVGGRGGDVTLPVTS